MAAFKCMVCGKPVQTINWRENPCRSCSEFMPAGGDGIGEHDCDYVCSECGAEPCPLCGESCTGERPFENTKSICKGCCHYVRKGER